MSLVRKYKLHKLGILPDEQTIILFEYLEDELSNLESFCDIVYPNFIFYINKNAECILYTHKKGEYWLIHPRITKRLINEFKLFSRENTIIQELMNKFYGINKLGLSTGDKYRMLDVETAYKLKNGIHVTS